MRWKRKSDKKKVIESREGNEGNKTENEAQTAEIEEQRAGNNEK